jgi:hypothetical protein
VRYKSEWIENKSKAEIPAIIYRNCPGYYPEIATPKTIWPHNALLTVGDAFAFNYHMTRRYSWC